LKSWQSISYTHFTELIKIEEPTKRRFYELVILKTQPTVKELKRLIDTLTYERVGLSENHKNSFEEVMKKIKPQQTRDLIKSHYFFEFLNIEQPHFNPAVGILLVTIQNKAWVEYAIADSDLDIFVSKYQLQLPDKSQLEAFINNELKNI